MTLIRWAAAATVLAVAVACASSAPTNPPTNAPTSAPSAPAATAAATTSGATFQTPEDAARAYIEGVRTADVDAILASSAVDDAAANFDFAAQADRLQVMQLVGNPGPAQYGFYADINRSTFAARLLGQSQTLAYSLLSPTPITANPVPADGAQASAFAAQVDPAKLAGLSVIDVRSPDPTLENDPKQRANALAMAHIYGASDDVQRVALIGLNGTDYEIGFELLKYGDRWKVLLQSAGLTTLPATGAATPITQDEFEQQTSGS